MLKKLILSVGLMVFSAVTLSAAVSINGAGASFPYPIYSSWAYNYKAATGNNVNYQSIGSGGGVKQITAKTVDFGATDDPLTIEKLQELNMIQFPAVIGGIVMVVNIDGVGENQLTLSADLIAQIYMGNIKKWNDVAIKELNKNVNLPDQKITVVYRSDSSGTTAVFTNYLAGANEAWKKSMGAGKSIDWKSGMGGKGNDGVAASVKQIKGSIGYVEYSYASSNNIPFSMLVNADKKVVKATYETFSAAANGIKWTSANGYNEWMTNAKGADAWPIAAATFVLLRLDEKAKSKDVFNFFKWAFKNGDNDAKKLLYIPLPEELKTDIIKYVDDQLK